MSLPTEPDPSADLGLLSPVTAGTVAESLSGDVAVARAMLRTESALLEVLASTGIAPASVADSAGMVAELPLDVRSLALASVAGGNPVIPLVTLVRAAVADEVAPWVHHGATSQDVLDTALMLVASDVLRQVDADLTTLASFLAGLADSTRAVPVVARTLTQQALPTTLGFRVAGWLAGVLDALQLVRACTPLPVSLGGPVGTGSAYGADAVAVLTGLADALDMRAEVASWHTRRAPVAQLAAALGLTGSACGKIAADLLVMGQTEVGEAREGSGGSSSSMAHKANPAQSVLVCAAARQLPPLAAVLGAASSPEQERPAGAWHAEWQPLRGMLRLAGAAAERSASYLPQVVLDHDAMASNLHMLLTALGKDEAWAVTETEHVGLWVDRVLGEHEEVCG